MELWLIKDLKLNFVFVLLRTLHGENCQEADPFPKNIVVVKEYVYFFK